MALVGSHSLQAASHPHSPLHSAVCLSPISLCPPLPPYLTWPGLGSRHNKTLARKSPCPQRTHNPVILFLRNGSHACSRLKVETGRKRRIWHANRWALDLISGPEQDLISGPQLNVSQGSLLEGGWWEAFLMQVTHTGLLGQEWAISSLLGLFFSGGLTHGSPHAKYTSL